MRQIGRAARACCNWAPTTNHRLAVWKLSCADCALVRGPRLMPFLLRAHRPSLQASKHSELGPTPSQRYAQPSMMTEQIIKPRHPHRAHAYAPGADRNEPRCPSDLGGQRGDVCWSGHRPTSRYCACTSTKLHTPSPLVGLASGLMIVFLSFSTKNSVAATCCAQHVSWHRVCWTHANPRPSLVHRTLQTT